MDKLWKTFPFFLTRNSPELRSEELRRLMLMCPLPCQPGQQWGEVGLASDGLCVRTSFLGDTGRLHLAPVIP